MFETFLFLYDVLWLKSTTLLFGGDPQTSWLDMTFLFLSSHILTNLWRSLCYGFGLDFLLVSVSSDQSGVSSPL